LYHDGESVCIQVFHKLLLAIVKNSKSSISTKLGVAFVHSQIASRVITLSLFTDFDLICHNSDKLSLPIPNISFIYNQALAVDHILVVQLDAI
jgi:hypothetical protein